METKDTLTKNYIFEGFYNLLKKNNCEDISVSDICKKAGVSRMSFYRNFKSKDDLINKSLEKTLMNLAKRLKSYDKINQYIVTREIFETIKNYKEAFESLKNSNYAKRFMDSVSQKLFNFSPEDKINPTKQYIPIFYFSALTGVINTWINNGAKENSDDMAKLICSVAEFPIFSEHDIQIK